MYICMYICPQEHIHENMHALMKVACAENLLSFASSAATSITDLCSGSITHCGGGEIANALSGIRKSG